MVSPIGKFIAWWNEALAQSPLKQKSAICVSTISDDGFPSGRFVDLKAVDEQGFTFCTYFDSKKGQDIRKNNKVALTIWWDHVGYQVRIKGLALPLPESETLKHWSSRTRTAQLTTLSCAQSQPIESDENLMRKLAAATKKYHGVAIPKPDSWGGYQVKPTSIEFLTFMDNRLHRRELFELASENEWRMKMLQP